jgi:hypothetical protein
VRLNRSEAEFSELKLTSKAVGFLALLTGFLYLRVMLGEGIPTIGIGNVEEGGVLCFALLAIATSGLLLGWWREGPGGLVALLGGLLLAGAIYATAGRSQLLAAIVYGSPFLVAGALFLACWWCERR